MVLLVLLFYDVTVSSCLLEVELSGVELLGNKNFSDKLSDKSQHGMRNDARK